MLESIAPELKGMGRSVGKQMLKTLEIPMNDTGEQKWRESLGKKIYRVATRGDVFLVQMLPTLFPSPGRRTSVSNHTHANKNESYAYK